jgi:hypothetical protein
MDLSANGRYEVNAGDRTSWTLSVYLENRISASPKLKVGTDRIDEQCSADGAEYRRVNGTGNATAGSDGAVKGTCGWGG